MKNSNYSTSIDVDLAPADVFNYFNDVPGWFKDKGFAGNSSNLNDEFIFRYGSGGHAHYSKQKLVEFVASKKVVWLVTDSMINWIEKNKEEWTNTKMVFEISTKAGKTVVSFTHEGMVPALACYSSCVAGWDMIIKGWLFEFINEGALSKINGVNW